MQIPNDVLNCLCEARIEGNLLFLNSEMDRPTYLKLDKVLQALGGKWKRGEKAHEFKSDPTDLIETAILTQQCTTTKDIQFYPTPTQLAAHMVDLIQIPADATVLEPSAGTGALAKAVLAVRPDARVTCYEKDITNFETLMETFEEQPLVSAHYRDFLEVKPEPIYDRVIMNPPFTKRQDIKHIEHAFQFLKPDPSSRLISVLSSSVNFRTDNLTLSFRHGLKRLGARLVELPDDSFVESGTRVKASLVVLAGRPMGSDAIALQRISAAAR